MVFLVVNQKNYQNITSDQFVELKNEFFFGIRQHSELIRQQFENANLLHLETHMQFQRYSLSGQRGEIFRLSTKNLWQIILLGKNGCFTSPAQL